jgi:GT2 family glycosyltransferase
MPLVLCLNAEVILEAEWIAKCVHYIRSHARCGACCGRVKPERLDRAASRWRYRFLEAKYEVEGKSGPISHATGHAILFRREALDEVGGWAEELTNFHEDSDVCFRLQDAGWDTHVNICAQAISIQHDSLRTICRKHLRNDYWALDTRGLDHPYTRPVEWPGFFFHVTKGLFIRLARNAYRRYWSLLPIDVAVWGYSLWLGAHINYDEAASAERSVTMPQVEGQP